MQKLSRKAVREALETTPLDAILSSKPGALTRKQTEFARQVALGATKADAYRSAYDVTSKYTMASKPYELMRDERIQREIEAYSLAIEAAKYRTPAALRELVIQGLVQVALNPDAKDAVKVQALKTIGTITEVAAFTERKEVRTISSSEDAKAQVLEQLQSLIKAQATDIDAVDIQARDLLSELSGEPAEKSETPPDETHPPGTPPSTE